MGECDWNGKVVSESYIHYYYAPCTIQELEDIIGDCFGDYRIVRDCINFMGNLALTELVDVKTVSSEKEYLDYVDRDTLCFRVYFNKELLQGERT